MAGFPRRIAVVLLAVPIVAGLGCGGSDVPPPVDPAEAERQLEAALAAWKAGEPFDSLAAKDPPIVFTEPLWKNGTTLVSYDVGAVELNGRQGRCTAKLKLRDPSGKEYDRSIGYVIDTTPRVVIVRENLGL